MAPYGKPAPSVFAEVWEMLLSPRTAAGDLPRNQTVRALLWAAVLGILGVMTGFAAFIAWVAETKPWSEVLPILVVVAAIAAIGEQARHIITHGGKSHAHAGHRREQLFRTFTSILAGFAIVLLFEFANAAWDKGGEKLQEALGDLVSLGHEPLDTRIRLLTVVLIWIASGAVVAAVLVRRILSMRPATEALVPSEVAPWEAKAAAWLGPLWTTRFLRDGLAAAAIAAVACALFLFASVLLLDGVSDLYLMASNYPEWHARIREFEKDGGITGYLVHPAVRADDLLSDWLPPLLYRLWWLFALGAGYLWWHSAWMRTVIVAVLLAFVFVPAVAPALPKLLKISGLYALVWAFPAFVLGAISPYLRNYRPHQWGFITCAVGLALGLLAALQTSSDVLSITVICAAFAVLIGLVLIFSPPTRDYLPLIAVVCGLLSYAVSAAIAGPLQIVEGIVFLHHKKPEPKQLVDVEALKSPSSFTLRLEGRDWEIGKEVFGQLKDIVKCKEVPDSAAASGKKQKCERNHERWLKTHQLLTYISYLQEPVKSSGFASLLKLLRPSEVEHFPLRHLFTRELETYTKSGIDAKPGSEGRCRLSAMECLAKVAKSTASSTEKPEWTYPMLKEWASSVAEALEADLRWRWQDQSTGKKLHIALSGAIGFFLALAALVAWQIRNAYEVPPKLHSGWQ